MPGFYYDNRLKLSGAMRYQRVVGFSREHLATATRRIEANDTTCLSKCQQHKRCDIDPLGLLQSLRTRA
eukprot:CAMPEP_0116862742 /NCGR_PEP_ID=MMETSP0418-20121206/23811_1 /TAXON_ID=1158023 /ORGANISM="Astrosyne radiata, Strain 13vi08-1A" /LENGTH=68 /DNA_ID=CAMNT_0004497637 /DNA_START=239 /DNA_END=445 /DNA_ORIENTATION=-